MTYATMEMHRSPVTKTIRKVLPWLVLAIVLGTVVTSFQKYQTAAKNSANRPLPSALTVHLPTVPGATASTTGKGTKVSATTKTTAKSSTTVLVLIDGLNFHNAPNRVSDSYRGLDKGEKLVWMSTKNGWYQVKASDGQVGWVSAGGKYTKLVRGR